MKHRSVTIDFQELAYDELEAFEEAPFCESFVPLFWQPAAQTITAAQKQAKICFNNFAFFILFTFLPKLF